MLFKKFTWAFRLQKLVSMEQLGVWADRSVNESRWVVLMEGWSVESSTIIVKSLSLLLNLGTYKNFFLFLFCLFLFFLLPAALLIFS